MSYTTIANNATDSSVKVGHEIKTIIYAVSQTKFTTLVRYEFDIHKNKLVLMIFGSRVTEKVKNKIVRT